MANLMLQDWHEMSPSYENAALITSGLFGNPKTPELVPVSKTFIANANVAFFSGRFPKDMFDVGREFQLAECLASAELEDDPFKYAHAGLLQLSREVKELRNDYLHQRKKLPSLMAVRTDHSDFHASSERRQLMQEIELLMSMQVVALWTTCETLFADLWEAALNAHPHTLAELTGRKAKEKADSGNPLDEPTKQKREKMLPLGWLQKYGYDLHASMGTILKEKFNFSKLDGDGGIRDAYSAAFSIDGMKINALLDDPSIRGLNLVRNLVVHRAGVCDEKYRKEASGLPNIPQVKPGEKLELDGFMMTKLLPPALDCSMDLFVEVDTWIQNHR
jgi:hypothetical protein